MTASPRKESGTKVTEMKFSILKEPSKVSGYVKTAVHAADRNRNALGFLPPAAYQAQAEKGRLWVVIDESEDYVGHLMFGGSRQALKVTQVYVEPKSRRQRIAASAIDALKAYAQENQCQYIQARVAADLQANEFWEHNEFVIAKQVEGSETANRLINVRVWFVPNSGLFSSSSRAKNQISAQHKGLLRRPSYVIDTNVVIDIARCRQGYEDVEKLIQLGMKHEIRLRRTPELQKELARGKMERTSDFAIRFAELIVPLTPISDNELDDYIVQLSAIIFPHREMQSDLTISERSDLMHLAYCIKYEQDAFVTRDGPILKSSSQVAAQYGLEILTPYDITPPESGFLNTALQDGQQGETEFTWCAANTAKELIFQAFPDSLLASITAISPDWLTCQDQNQRLLCASHAGRPVAYAYVGWDSASAAWEVIISPLESRPMTRLLLDAVLAGIYDKSRADQCVGITLSLSQDSVDVYDQAVRSGFVSCQEPTQKESVLRLKRIVLKGVLDGKNWTNIGSSMRRFAGWRLDPRIPTYPEFVNTGVRVSSERGGLAEHAYLKLTNFEDLIAPGIVLTETRPAVIIPIRPKYASQLFPELEKTRQMLPRLPAGMYTERAYFSSSATRSPVKAGAIAVFYVSGSTGHGGTAVAVARVTGVAEMAEREARESYFSRGVMNLRESDTLIRVITFSNILELRNPVEFSWMKYEGIISGANLVTAQKINMKQLRKIVVQGCLRSSV